MFLVLVCFRHISVAILCFRISQQVVYCDLSLNLMALFFNVTFSTVCLRTSLLQILSCICLFFSSHALNGKMIRNRFNINYLRQDNYMHRGIECQHSFCLLFLVFIDELFWIRALSNEICITYSQVPSKVECLY